MTPSLATISSKPTRRAALGALAGLAGAWAASAFAASARAAAPIRVALVEALSGPIGNAGEAVFRNLVWACERVNARGGVDLGGGVRRPLQIVRYDSKGQPQEALSALQAALDDGITIVAQGNSSAVAAALIEAIHRHNERDPRRQVVFLNYAAVDPVLTNERCSFWHFRFDAHADMRMAALMGVLRRDAEVKSVYLIGQDYSFGQAVLREARRQLALQRPDVRIAGEDLHPLARVKDFAPYVTKIKASGAQAVITGNWGNDLTLLVRAARELQFEGKFYTFYGNALGAPAAIGEAGVGKVIAVADWFPNAPGEESRRLVEAFRQRFPNPADDYIHLRMQLMIEALAQALARAARAGGALGPDGAPTALALARALEQADVTLAGQRLRMRAEDHQAQQPLMVAVMERQGAPGVPFDVEGSGYGFRVLQRIEADEAQQPHTCRMTRPAAAGAEKI
ncbi:Leucine-, isoleucine-, valine-, threonine-, and alanine-binding protein [Tepidimonas alkaliphilus]|uniref:Leucine-, isoleucine-, valine-, threonine-, and alanine-binding protein n=1 Tax=Tepidimonas alkaliphilus TaxID=2588942 RepID=A0A554WD11_9BURK|nr:branched-chain amino acid ABC transporter substrate-binding protein [Tepidimonas alkaliphilus]TSE21447.1 Leucine-, isoleucine-, valine-, threonine-, and alanine-binding protein [Tepidimonas alkaliphilus]